MKCFYCKGNMTESTTTHFAEMNGKILAVKNVPCFKCSQCGETAYSLKTSRQLENILKNFENSLSEIEILSYSIA